MDVKNLPDIWAQRAKQADRESHMTDLKGYATYLEGKAAAFRMCGMELKAILAEGTSLGWDQDGYKPTAPTSPSTSPQSPPDPPSPGCLHSGSPLPPVSSAD